MNAIFTPFLYYTFQDYVLFNWIFLPYGNKGQDVAN